MTDFALEPTLPYGLDDRGADFWPTPEWCTMALLESSAGPSSSERVLDPAAGNGAILRVLLKWGWHPYAVELRDEELPGLAKLCPTMIGDWLRISRDHMQLLQACGGEPESIITNPPFSLALKFADACLSVGAPYVALLLPVTALAGSAQEWRNFWTLHPPTACRPLSRRPRFSGTGSDRVGVCWWIWRAGRKPMDLVPV